MPLRFGRTRPYASAEAFSQLYDQAHLAVYRYVYGITGGPAQEVEDLTAETFLKAWRARRRFQGDEDAAIGWLLQIARRSAIDSYRKRRSRPAAVQLDAIEEIFVIAGDTSPEEQVSIREQCRIVWHLLNELPPPKRELVVLRYMLGWRIKRIADHLSMNENTVSVALGRILAQLRQEWPDQFHTAERDAEGDSAR